VGDLEGLMLDHGLIILFALIGMESAGVPLPGETALIAAGVLAAQGTTRSRR
jgi:membrane protein DedA with SNARE-associated domain